MISSLLAGAELRVAIGLGARGFLSDLGQWVLLFFWNVQIDVGNTIRLTNSITIMEPSL